MWAKATYGVPGMTGDNEGRGVGLTDGVFDGTVTIGIRNDDARGHKL